MTLSGALSVGNQTPRGIEASDPTRKTVREFEGLLWSEVMKSLRRTVQTAEKSSFGRDVYTSMFDEQLAQNAALNGDTGLQEVLMKQLGLDRQEPIVAMTRGWQKPVVPSVMPHQGQLFAAPRDGHLHQGLDIAAPLGAEVRAPAAGIVRRVEREDVGSAGRWVEIEHPQGLVTRYMHLQSIAADLIPGNPIGAGEVFGTVGSTGTASTGPHLHFELRHYGVPYDPQGAFSVWPAGRQDPVPTYIYPTSSD